MIVDWKIGVYTRDANAKNSVSYDGSVTNVYLKHATDLKWTMTLNGVDELEFSLYLDDPAALQISRKQTVIRIWRNISDTPNGKFRTPLTANPDFCGIVTSITKSGEANKMTVRCMSPLWLLQSHFHIDNHRLVTDTVDYGDVLRYEGGNANGLDWDHSALMFRLIDLINGAFKFSGGDTGIRKPTTASYSGTGYLAGESLYWPQTIKVAPFFVQKGESTWPLVFDNLMARASSPDIHPKYIYDAGSKNTMYFQTDVVRGSDRSATISFDYKTGNKNLQDIEESSSVVPGTYGNFVWVVGDGGPNGGSVATAEDASDQADNGIFMARKDIKGSKGTAGEALAEDMLKVALISDSEVYSVDMAVGDPLYYGIDWFLGDRINLNAAKGALSVINKKQRIYAVTLGYSDNNIETVSVQISDDFKRKFAE